MIYLDLPNPVNFGPDKPWEAITTFHGPNAKQEAINYIRKNIDPNCDNEGRIQIITEVKSEEDESNEVQEKQD